MKTKYLVIKVTIFGRDVKYFETENDALEYFKSVVLDTTYDRNNNNNRITYITDVDDYWNQELSDDRSLEEKTSIEKKFFKGEGFYLNGEFIQGEPKSYGEQSAYSDNNNNYYIGIGIIEED